MAAKVGPPFATISAVEIDGLISLYSSHRRELLALNETASDLWRLCDGEHDLQGLVARLSSAYGVEPGAIEDDVRRALRGMVDLGLIPAPADA
jgi:hypothetical protein